MTAAKAILIVEFADESPVFATVRICTDLPQFNVSSERGLHPREWKLIQSINEVLKAHREDFPTAKTEGSR